MDDLQQIVIPKIMTNWEEIAESLRYEDEDIEAIKQNGRGDAKKCCREFFKDWRKSGHGTGPKTWSTLFNVLSDPNRDLIDISIVEEMVTKVNRLQ